MEKKNLYKKLAKLFHPDRGGDAELMKELTSQYENGHSCTSTQGQGGESYTHGYHDGMRRAKEDIREQSSYSNRKIAGLNQNIYDLKGQIIQKQKEIEFLMENSTEITLHNEKLTKQLEAANIEIEKWQEDARKPTNPIAAIFSYVKKLMKAEES